MIQRLPDYSNTPPERLGSGAFTLPSDYALAPDSVAIGSFLKGREMTAPTGWIVLSHCDPCEIAILGHIDRQHALHNCLPSRRSGYTSAANGFAKSALIPRQLACAAGAPQTAGTTSMACDTDDEVVSVTDPKWNRSSNGHDGNGNGVSELNRQVE
jgi:hypothetical protein